MHFFLIRPIQWLTWMWPLSSLWHKQGATDLSKRLAKVWRVSDIFWRRPSSKPKNGSQMTKFEIFQWNKFSRSTELISREEVFTVANIFLRDISRILDKPLCPRKFMPLRLLLLYTIFSLKRVPSRRSEHLHIRIFWSSYQNTSIFEEKIIDYFSPFYTFYLISPFFWFLSVFYGPYRALFGTFWQFLGPLKIFHIIVF